MANVAEGSSAFMRPASRKQDGFCIVFQRARSGETVRGARDVVADAITDDTNPTAGSPSRQRVGL
jgi:hypothetical protein